jgi:hypothetical protein
VSEKQIASEEDIFSSQMSSKKLQQIKSESILDSMNASEIIMNNRSTYNSQQTDSLRLMLKESYQRINFNYGNVLNAMRDTHEIENERRLRHQESEDFQQYLLVQESPGIRGTNYSPRDSPVREAQTKEDLQYINEQEEAYDNVTSIDKAELPKREKPNHYRGESFGNSLPLQRIPPLPVKAD